MQNSFRLKMLCKSPFSSKGANSSKRSIASSVEQPIVAASSETITFCISPIRNRSISTNICGSALMNIARYTRISCRATNYSTLSDTCRMFTWVRATELWSLPHAVETRSIISVARRGLRWVTLGLYNTSSGCGLTEWCVSLVLVDQLKSVSDV